VGHLAFPLAMRGRLFGQKMRLRLKRGNLLEVGGSRVEGGYGLPLEECVNETERGVSQRISFYVEEISGDSADRPGAEPRDKGLRRRWLRPATT